MRYFAKMAERAFITNEHGKRLFLARGRSRPYLVPDLPTEMRLLRKLTWRERISFSLLIPSQALLAPYFFKRPWIFFIFAGTFLVLNWIFSRILFHSDLRSLERAPYTISKRAYLAQFAKRRSEFEIQLGLIGSILFMAIGGMMVAVGLMALGEGVDEGRGMICFGFLVLGFFGYCAAGSAQALNAKQSPGGNLDQQDSASTTVQNR